MRTPTRSPRWRFLMGTGAATALAASLAWSAPIEPPQSEPPQAESVSLPAELPADAVDLTDKVEVTVNGRLRSTSRTSHSVVFTVKNTSDEDLKGPIIVLVDQTGIDGLKLVQTDGKLSDDRPYAELVGKNGGLKSGKSLRSEKLVFETTAALSVEQRNAFDLKLRVCRLDEAAALADKADDADKIEGKSYTQKKVDKVAAVQEKWTMPLIKSGKGQVFGTAIGEDDKGELIVKVYTERPNTDDIVPDTIDGIPVKIVPIGRMFRAEPAYNDVIYPDGKPRKAKRGNEDDFAPVPDKGSAEAGASPEGEEHGLPLLLDPTVRFNRPVPIGVSIANADALFVNPDFLNCYSGTLSCRCVDALGDEYILTNLHVGGALLVPFDDPFFLTARVGDRIVQPSTGDAVNFCSLDPNNVIGRVADFEQILIPPEEDLIFFFRHRMDACVVRANAGAVGFAPPADGYPRPRRDVVHRPRIGMGVQKYGRTTVYTSGHITAINVIALVPYGLGDDPPSFFVQQLEIANQTAFGQPFSQGGDSGSLIVEHSPGTPNDGRPVALLFAGGPRGAVDITIANPIGPILARFGLQIDDGQGAPFQAGMSGTMGGAVGPMDRFPILLPDDEGGGDGGGGGEE